MCGAFATTFMAGKTLTSLSAAAHDAPPTASARRNYSIIALCSGVVAAAIFYLPKVFLPLAAKEIARIEALDDPRPWHFFHRWRLLALGVLIPSAVAVEKLWADRYYVGCLVFGGNVVPVAIGLTAGATVLARALCGGDAAARFGRACGGGAAGGDALLAAAV